LETEAWGGKEVSTQLACGTLGLDSRSVGPCSSLLAKLHLSNFTCTLQVRPFAQNGSRETEKEYVKLHLLLSSALYLDPEIQL
jgi:hypothetical protein